MPFENCSVGMCGSEQGLKDGQIRTNIFAGGVQRVKVVEIGQSTGEIHVSRKNAAI